jgi:hypothetical protein
VTREKAGATKAKASTTCFITIFCFVMKLDVIFTAIHPFLSRICGSPSPPLNVVKKCHFFFAEGNASSKQSQNKQRWQQLQSMKVNPQQQ